MSELSISNSDANLIRELSEAIADLVPRVFGEGADVESLTPTRIDRRYSFMFRYWVRKPNGNRQPLLVKIPHESWIKSIDEAIASDQVRQEIQNEFVVMQSIYTVIQNSHRPMLFAINPVGGYIIDFNALVMEEVPLQMLKEGLSGFSLALNNTFHWTDFENRLALAGEWLRVIHDAFYKGRNIRLKELDVKKTFQDEITSLEKLIDKNLENIRARFLQLYELTQNLEVPLSALHNDFHLGNIFFTPDGKVGALDPNWQESGPVYKDLASLLIDPVTRKRQVLFLGSNFRRSHRLRFERAVLRGYYGEIIPPYTFLYLFCALSALEKWQSNVEILTSGTRVMRLIGLPFINFYFNRLINEYLTMGLTNARPTH